MLTIETLKQNQALSGLTDEQLNAIALLSKNDEATVLGTKIGEIHGQYDNDIISVTGKRKNDGEKTYDFMKRVLKEYKQNADSFETEKAALNAKISELESGTADASLKQSLTDANTQITNLTAKVQELTATKDKAKAEYEKGLKQAKVEFAFDSAASTFKFKDGISESLKSMVLKNAISEITKTSTPDFVEKDGKQVLVFRDKNGVIMTNRDNNLEPFTAEEMLRKTPLQDIIEEKRESTGGGTKNPTGTGTGNKSVILDLSAVKSQIEADTLIENYLLQQGLTRDSSEFAEKSLEIRTENEIAKLPIR